MSVKVLFGNLPEGTTVDEVRQELESRGAPILSVEPVEGGNPDKMTFVVEVDVDHETAMVMADRRKDRFFKGRKVTLYVPAMMR